MSTVSDVRSLGRQLMIIAGLRAMYLLNARFGSLDEISFLPPNILFWLKSLVSEYSVWPICLVPKILNAHYFDLLLINFKCLSILKLSVKAKFMSFSK